MQEIFLRWKIDGISNVNRPETQADSKVKPPIGTYITSDREASLFHRLPGFSGEGFSDFVSYSLTVCTIRRKIGLCNNRLNRGDAKKAIENNGIGVTARAHKPNGLLAQSIHLYDHLFALGRDDVEDACIQDLSAGLRSGKWPTQRNLTHIGGAMKQAENKEQGRRMNKPYPFRQAVNTLAASPVFICSGSFNR